VSRYAVHGVGNEYHRKRDRIERAHSAVLGFVAFSGTRKNLSEFRKCNRREGCDLEFRMPFVSPVESLETSVADGD